MASSCIFDVSLSFSGEDTRKNFAGHILAAFDRHGFYTFNDDTKLKSGTEIGPGLLKAIDQSRASVIAFSKKYASSRWCLNELVKIMECKRTLNQLVIPIFYDVDPSHVQKQNGYYAVQFESHKRTKDSSIIPRRSHSKPRDPEKTTMEGDFISTMQSSSTINN